MEYEECQKGQYHQGEALNCVCIDEKCSQNELVCSICQQEQHDNHLIIPLKIFMESIYNIDNKSKNDINIYKKDDVNSYEKQQGKQFKDQLNSQQKNNQTLSQNLYDGNSNYCHNNNQNFYAQQLEEVDRQHQFAQKYVKDYQEKVISGFKECLDKIDTFYKGIKAEIQKNQYLQETWLQKFQESLIKSQENIKSTKKNENLININQQRVQSENNKICYPRQNKSKYQDNNVNKSIKDMLQIIGFDQNNKFKCFYKIDFDYVIQLCEQRYQKLATNKDSDVFLNSITAFKTKCDDIYGEIPSLSTGESNQANKKVQQLSSFLKQIRFSETLKSAAVQIKIPTVATQTQNESSGQRFCLLEPCLSHSIRLRWGFKIKNLVGWIGLGICIQSIIKGFNFHFKYQQIGHGSYLLSGNGYTWSHSNASQNSVNKSFQFTTGETIYIEFDPLEKKLKFLKASTLEKHSLDLTFVHTDEIVPCVNLCSIGDEIEVINDEKVLSALTF